MPNTTIALYADGAEVDKLAAARLLADHRDGTVVTIFELADEQKVVERVEVYPRRRQFGDQIASAGVNWGGIGTVGAAKARTYAAILTLAAELIETANLLAAEAAA